MRFVDYVRNHYVVLGTKSSYSCFTRLSCKYVFTKKLIIKKTVKNSEKASQTHLM